MEILNALCPWQKTVKLTLLGSSWWKALVKIDYIIKLTIDSALHCLDNKPQRVVRVTTCTYSIFTQSIFMATSLKPFSSNLWMILPTRFRWTPSGLIMMKVRSWFGLLIFVGRLSSLLLPKNNSRSLNVLMLSCSTRGRGWTTGTSQAAVRQAWAERAEQRKPLNGAL